MKETDAASILVVEDEPGVLRAVQRILSPRHEVVPAQGARDAEAHLSRERPFDIAIVDIQLPDGSGYAVNRMIHERSPETDVILMTGSTSRQDQKLFRALEEDAFYFLFKPFDRRVLIALVERCLRLRRLQEENQAHLERLARDQAKAREIQRNLLPETPLEHAGWSVIAHFDPAEEVSGDIYYARSLADNGLEEKGLEEKGLAEKGLEEKSHGEPTSGPPAEDALALLVADVVGHGLPAAMYAGMLRSTVDAARRLDPHPRTIYDRLIESLDFFASNSGASLIYGLLHDDGRLQFMNAGHPSALVERASAPGRLEPLAPTGPKLLSASVIRDLPRDSDEIRLDPGDRILFFTDGVSEAKDPDQHEWGVGGVEEAYRRATRLEDGTPRPVGEALATFLESFRIHCAGRPVDDDVTVVLVERLG